jgi:DNA-binding response OmpR family regulator
VNNHSVSSGANSPTILLLDDDQYFRQIQSCILAAGGFSIIETQDPQNAALSLKEKKPDLAIVAYKLRGVAGVSWIEQARASQVDIPMVFVSSSNLDAETTERLHNALNVRLILKKPINLTTFLGEIQGVLSLLPVVESSPSTELDFAVPEPQPGDEEGADSDAAALLELEIELKKARMEYLHFTLEELDLILARAKTTDIRNKDMFDDVQRIAHRIRGTAGTFGLAKISKLAENIEECLAPDAELSSHLCASITWLLDDLRSSVGNAAADCESVHTVSSTNQS